jgi:starch synthase (maltosyl-transferring)
VTATVFREGHDAVAATVVLTDPDGVVHTRVRMDSLGPGLGPLGRHRDPDREGRWSFRVEGWADATARWEHDAVIKVGCGGGRGVMLEEGARVLESALALPSLRSAATGSDAAAASDVQTLRNAVLACGMPSGPPRPGWLRG